MTEVVYGSERQSRYGDREFRNARLWTGKLFENASRVFVVGDFPRIVTAYKNAGVEVVVVAPGADMPRVPEKIPPMPEEVARRVTRGGRGTRKRRQATRKTMEASDADA